MGETLPTVAEFLADPTAIYELKRMLGKYCKGLHIADSEEKQADLLTDCLVFKWELYTGTYDPSKGLPFRAWVFTKFDFIVRRTLGRPKTLKDSSTVAIGELDLPYCPAPQALAAIPDSTVHAALAQLSPEDSWIVYNYSQGHTFENIGQQLRIGRSNVSKRYHEALKHLKGMLTYDVEQAAEAVEAVE